SQLAGDHMVIRVSSSYAKRTGNVPEPEILTSNPHDHLRETVDGHHLLRADVDRPLEIRFHQAPNTLEALINVKERACLHSVPPDFNFAPIFSLGDLAANRCG